MGKWAANKVDTKTKQKVLESIELVIDWDKINQILKNEAKKADKKVIRIAQIDGFIGGIGVGVCATTAWFLYNSIKEANKKKDDVEVVTEEDLNKD